MRIKNFQLLLTVILLMTSCSSSSVKNESKKDLKGEVKTTNLELELLDPSDIGSAFEGDREKRLAFLTKEIDSKREIAKKYKADKGINETAALELEILTNEMLLLEAEKFGLEDGLDLRQPSDD